MKRKILSIALLAMLALGCGAKASAQSVSINQKTFPNKIFRTEVSKWDRDRNGTLSAKEIKNIKKISMRTTAKNQNKTMNLAGIERLNHLTELRVENGYRIKNLKSKSLKKLTVDQYALSKLSVKGVPNLTAFSVNPKNEISKESGRGYSAVKDPLTDFSGNRKLVSLYYSYKHTKKNLKISKCHELEELSLGYEVSGIDLSNFLKLQWLELSGKSNMTLDLSMLSNLKTVSCEGRIANVLLPKESQLEEISFDGVNGLDLSDQTKLKSVVLGMCQLTSDLSQNKDLQQVNLYLCKVDHALDFSQKPDLQKVNIYGINDQMFDFSQSSQLESIEIDSGHGLSLIMPNSEGLEYIQLCNVDIPEVNLSGCPNVKRIEFRVDGMEKTHVIPRVIANTLKELIYVNLHGNLAYENCNTYSLDSFDISQSSKIRTLFIENLPAYQVKKEWFPDLELTNL